MSNPLEKTNPITVGRVVNLSESSTAKPTVRYPNSEAIIRRLKLNDKRKDANLAVVDAAVAWFESGYKDREAAHLADVVEDLITIYKNSGVYKTRKLG